MKALIEQESFSARLRLGLKNAELNPDSPTELAREFNLRFSGAAVTVHAARKWLVGEAIPTQPKLRAIAQWLGVSPEWLRFGERNGVTAQGGARAGRPARREQVDLAMLADMQRLDEQHRRIAREFVRMLVKSQAGAPEGARDGAADDERAGA